MIRKCCFLLLFCELTLGSCMQNKDYLVFYQNYIQAYYQGELELKDWASLYAPGDLIDLETTPIPWFYIILANAKPISRKPECLQEYERLATRNGDTHFNSWADYSDGGTPYAFADNFQTMHVVSDADWDEAHPAGKFLDDLLLCNWLSHADFVRNDYNEEFRLNYKKKLVSELIPEDMEMIGCGWVDVRISFISAPTLAKTHTLTLTWTTVDGNVKTASITCTPEVDPALQ